ncbi:YHS domain-containing (seleno)protein [Flavimaricola marinus]|uniref:YHS domain protein n=1 Tax=Flavimaricola marinus TaxID=1819565 RepID=A0A238LID0_9RHOB|nr:YHS domain-containing (seleno)protein [Flavimaricola marinus]SMY09164.1 hypothetical protein LOM8899_03326 [Flavimaricola marinus]
MLSRRHVLGLAASLPVMGLIGRPAMAEPEVFSDMGTALRGADPVAYFTEGAPVSGRPEFGLMWRGAVWEFASARHRTMFEMDPERFAPQYGGYCAFAMSQGYVAPTVPEAWTIHNGKLYMNYSLAVRERWQADIDGYVALADSHWPDALGA